MPRIQNVGVGNYIRNPKGVRGDSSGVEVLQVGSNEGGSFICYPVISSASGKIVLNTKRYYNIPIDTMVDQVSI